MPFDDLLNRTSRAARFTRLITLSVLALGLLSFIVVYAALRINDDKYHFFIHADVIHELQIELAKSRVWLEEFGRGTIRLKGDKDCWDCIDTAGRMAATLLEGGKTPHGQDALPLSEPSQRIAAEEIRALILEYRQLARQRHGLGLTHPKDDRLESVFSTILEKSFRLDSMIEAKHKQDRTLTQKLLAALFGFWSMTILAAAIGLRSYENRRRHDEEAVLLAKNEWERTFDAVPDHIMIVDRDYRVRRVNRALARDLGADPANLIGRACHELMHSGGVRAAECPHTLTLLDGKEHSSEVRDEKTGKYFSVNVSPLFDRNGKVEGSVHVARDITLQKKTDESMKVKDNAIASSLNAIAILDLGGKITYANAAFLAWWGYASEEDVIGQPASAMSADPHKLENTLAELRAEGGWSGERIARRRDGSTFAVEVSAHLVKDREGKPLCLMASFMDITERRALEKELAAHRQDLELLVDKRTAELRESEAMYRRLSKEFNVILDAMPDSLLLFSTDHRVLWANQSAIEVLGKGHDTLMGRLCAEIWHERDTQCQECPISKSFESGMPESAQITTPSGRLWAIRAYPITDETAKVSSVMQLATDITDKVVMQAEHMRAMHLASLGELAAGVAHEINNPINGIINYAQILSVQAAQSDEGRDLAQRVIKEGKRIANIVRSLLSFARDRKEEKAPADVASVLSDTLALTETQLRKNGIHFAIELAPSLPPVFVNVQQIQQVFLNVINNARYALNERYSGPDENKKLLISAEPVVVENRQFVRVSFRDHGTGIPRQHVGRVMDPFYTTKPAGIGTGLGLSISHGIITDHEGRMWIESIEQSHTTVTIDLPAFRGRA